MVAAAEWEAPVEEAEEVIEAGWVAVEAVTNQEVGEEAAWPEAWEVR